MRLSILCCAVSAGSLCAHELSVQSGLLRNDIAPAADFGSVAYRHGAYRVGAFTSPDRSGVLASYSSTESPFVLELGQREKSLDQGFVVSNGAYLPWTKNFAFGEPVGMRIGYKLRYGGIETAYYQHDAKNAGLVNLSIYPVSWLKISGGAAALNAELAPLAAPLAALLIGNLEDKDGFRGGVEYSGGNNALLHARYSSGFTIRGFAFRHAGDNPLASGIYAAKAGGALQLMSEEWFAQYFHTDIRFGMLRFAGEYLTAVTVYEEKTQLAGFSLRNSATGFHLRSGATLAGDGSLQTLAGLGLADLVFLGGGHYILYKDQPLEPVIFPSEWYSSLLLQSSGMRVRDRGYKLLFMVNNEVIQGFLAAAYAEDARGRERFDLFMRIAGRLTF